MKETLPRSKPWSPHQRPLPGVAQQCSKTGPAGGGCYLVAKLCPTLSQPQGPQSMGFSRQEYWSGLPHPPRGIFPTQESNLSLLHQQVDSLPLSHLKSPGPALEGPLSPLLVGQVHALESQLPGVTSVHCGVLRQAISWAGEHFTSPSPQILLLESWSAPPSSRPQEGLQSTRDPRLGNGDVIQGGEGSHEGLLLTSY